MSKKSYNKRYAEEYDKTDKAKLEQAYQINRAITLSPEQYNELSSYKIDERKVKQKALERLENINKGEYARYYNETYKENYREILMKFNNGKALVRKFDMIWNSANEFQKDVLLSYLPEINNFYGKTASLESKSVDPDYESAINDKIKNIGKELNIEVRTPYEMKEERLGNIVDKVLSGERGFEKEIFDTAVKRLAKKYNRDEIISILTDYYYADNDTLHYDIFAYLSRNRL